MAKNVKFAKIYAKKIAKNVKTTFIFASYVHTHTRGSARELEHKQKFFKTKNAHAGKNF